MSKKTSENKEEVHEEHHVHEVKETEETAPEVEHEKKHIHEVWPSEGSAETPLMHADKKVINVKWALIVALVVVVGALLYSSRGFFIAATVNGSPISRMAVISALEQSSGKKVLDTLITKKLIGDAIARSGEAVTSKEVDAEIKTIEDQVTAAQQGTLTELLAAQGMTLSDLRDQITIQKQLEQLLGDKVSVSDEEVAAYISANKLNIPKEQEDVAKTEITQQLKQQKMSTEAATYIQELRTKAKINYLGNY